MCTDFYYSCVLLQNVHVCRLLQILHVQQVLVTREELATKLLVKLGMELSPANLVRVVTGLRWECYGAASLITHDGIKRTVVGCGKSADERRDFVRLKGTVQETALSVQVCSIVNCTSLRPVSVGTYCIIDQNVCLRYPNVCLRTSNQYISHRFVCS